MKSCILISLSFLVVLCSCSSWMTNTDPAKHAETVERSRKEGNTVLSMDTIFHAGVAYAVMEKQRVDLPGYLSSLEGYNVHSLSGRQIVTITPVDLFTTLYYSYQFIDGSHSQSAFATYSEGEYAQADLLVSYNLINAQGLRTGNVPPFVEAHGKPGDPDPQYGGLIRRDRTASITSSSNDIRQQNVPIGHYDSTGIMIAGISTAQIMVQRMDHSMCATVTYAITNTDTTASVVTTKDNKTYVLRREPKVAPLQTVLWFLVNGSYL